MKLSIHSKKRMSERTGLDSKNQKPFFANALRLGVSAGNMKDGPVKDFLLNKEKNRCKAKLYKGYVFIYSKNSKRLYTMYKLPEELLGGKNEI